jgi:hypothetical protein
MPSTAVLARVTVKALHRSPLKGERGFCATSVGF